jgi:hypothetical protein
MATTTPEHLLAEIEDLLRTMPPFATIRHDNPDTLAWFGRASAVLTRWSLARSVSAGSFISALQGPRTIDPGPAYRGLVTLLHEAQHALRMETVGPLTVAVSAGKPFDYFDEIRTLVASAKLELFFVDPYLDAEFVSRYLPNASSGILIRLLGREKISTLVPAVEVLRQQSASKIEVRSASGFHDRYLFVDRSSGYHSGASFKDGAKSSPTTITQVTDAFGAVFGTYEQLWAAAKVQA